MKEKYFERSLCQILLKYINIMFLFPILKLVYLTNIGWLRKEEREKIG